MCLAIYIAADQPLPVRDGDKLRVQPLKPQRWNRGLFTEEYRYRLGAPGCACDLLSDGLTRNEEQARQELLDEVLAYLAEAARDGPVEALVCWGGDEKKAASAQALTPEAFRNFDFDGAWDAPRRLTIRTR